MQYSLRVGIYYDSTPWRKISFEDGLIRCEEAAPRNYEREVLEENPNFWKEVQQLSFAFRDLKNAKMRIRDFYREYGPVLASTSDTNESISQVALMLEWFRHVTMMVEWIEKDKMPVLLRQLQPLEQKISDSPFPIVVFFNAGNPALNGIPSWPSIWTWLKAPLNTLTEEELQATAWTAVMRSFWQYFRNAFQPTQSTHTQHGHLGISPSHIPGLWTSNVPSALSAAVYQWYFDELADKLSARSGTLCAADGCERLVPSRRLKYTAPNRRPFCSDKCRERQKKRRQRRRVHDGGTRT